MHQTVGRNTEEEIQNYIESFHVAVKALAVRVSSYMCWWGYGIKRAVILQFLASFSAPWSFPAWLHGNMARRRLGFVLLDTPVNFHASDF